jgi:hypothetical protein
VIALAALAASRAERCESRQVRREAEPLEVVEDGLFELWPRSLAIVVLDPEAHLAAGVPREPPDIDCVEEMTEVQVAGG